MRTQKRFSPTLLERYKQIGRGSGTYETYIPWHRVGRSDPSSMGRSHLMMWRDRQRELLSDGEWVGLLFSTMLNNLVDVREQHNLSLEDNPFELADYDIRFAGSVCPGTRSIAKQLGIKHPRVNGGGRSDDWVMTTDQVLVLKTPTGDLQLLAVAYKPDGSALKKRTRQLLSIENAYWSSRSVQWLLITPELFNEAVGLTLRRTVPWGLGFPVEDQAKNVAVEVVTKNPGHSFTYMMHMAADRLGDLDHAQRAIWQSVWNGSLPLDLTVGWRPHLPVRMLDLEDFVRLNPVASRRSSWI